MRLLRYLFILALWCAVSGTIHAQDLRRELPASPERETPSVTVDTLSRDEIRSELVTPGPNEELLAPELRGLRFYGAPPPDGTLQPTVKGIDFGDVSIPGSETLSEELRIFLGKPVAISTLYGIRAGIRAKLASEGRPFALVYFPEQDITDGMLAVVVQPAVLDRVDVQGARWFSPDSYISPLRLSPDGSIDAHAIRRGMDRLNRNPFRRADIQAEEGTKPGTTRMVVRTEERFPLEVFAGYDNTGTQITGEDRLFGGFLWGNALGRGDLLNYQVKVSADSDASQSHGINYASELTGGQRISLSGGYSRIKASPIEEVDQKGESWQAGVRALQPFGWAPFRLESSATFGLDFKSSDNNLVFGGTPVVDNQTHVAQVSAGLQASRTAARSAYSGSATLFFSPGGISEENDDDAYEASRPGSDPSYLYGHVGLGYRRNLPVGLVWNVEVEAQLASANLLGSEQAVGGGNASYRGYEEGEVYRDNSVGLHSELYLPTIRPLSHIGPLEIADALRVYVFYDLGTLWNVDPLDGERDDVSLHSAGLGASYQLGPWFSVNVVHGFQLEESGSSDSGDDYRTHISVVARL